MVETGITRLLTSSKSLAVFGSMLMVFALMVLHIDPEPFMAYAWKVVTAYVFGAAGEDIAKRLAERPRSVPASPVTINNTVPPPSASVPLPTPASVPVEWVDR